MDTVGPNPPAAMRLRLRRLVDGNNGQNHSGYGFGFETQDRGSPPAMQIKALLKGCEADKSGLVRNGDIILRINDVDVSQCSYEEALKALESTQPTVYSSFLVRAPFGFVTRLVTTFDQDGTPHTLRITEKIGHSQTANSASTSVTSTPTHVNSKSSPMPPITSNGDSTPAAQINGLSNDSQTVVAAAAATNNSLPQLNIPDKSDVALNSNKLTTTGHTIPNVSLQRRGSATGLRPIRLRNVSSNQITFDVLHHTAKQPLSCTEAVCSGSLMKQTKESINCQAASAAGSAVGTISSCPAGDGANQCIHGSQSRSKEQLLSEAYQFMEQYYASVKRLHTPAHRDRLRQIETEVRTTGTYNLRQTELIYGAKLGWRNAPRCIGRIQWSKLQVFDARSCTTARDMFETICNQIKYATNRGNLRSAITIFPQRIAGREDFRIWNPQLISFAGYPIESDDASGQCLNGDSSLAESSTVIGDPANVEFTKICMKLGWKGAGTKWDILPIVVSVPGEDPQLFPLSEELVLRVPLVHPSYEWFEKLNLQWYALPAVSSMKFDVGGIEFPACPFSGWYMDTEIAVRDLCDVHRYNVLPLVAEQMKLEINSNASLWKDRAVLEVNTAVLFSYQKANVTIVDHYTAAESFMKHLENENRLRGGCPADWVWVVPPVSGSLMPVFHQEMLSYELKPAYRYQDPPWKTHVWRSGHLDMERNSLGGTGTPRKLRFKEIAKAVKFTSNLFGKALSKRIKATILYATETGRSEQFAKRLAQIFSHAFNVSVNCMDSYDTLHLEHETLLLIVTSTFGNGDPPENGESFAKQLQAIKVTGDTAPDLDRESISLPVTYLRYSSLDVADQLQNGSSNSTNNSKNELNFEDMRPHSAGPTSPKFLLSTVDENFAFSDHVGPLSNVRFCVFALGSSAYPNFCSFGRYLDTMLEDLGGERVTKLGIGDELCGQEQSFNEWATDAFGQACDVFCLTDELDMGEVMKRATQKPMQWSKDNVLLEDVSNIEPKQLHETKRIEKALTKLSNNKKVIHYKLVERQYLHKLENNLSQLGNERQTIRVVLQSDLPQSNSDHSGQLHGSAANAGSYLPGDHLAVYPENSLSLVDAIIGRLLNVNSDSSQLLANANKPYLIKIRSQNSLDSQNNVLSLEHNVFAQANGLDANQEDKSPKWILHERLPAPVSLREALTRYLDITTPPTQQFLTLLAEHTDNKRDIDRLKHLAKDSVAYEEWKAQFYPNLLEVLSDFNTVKLPLELIFTQLPLLQPRYYSISSSPLLHSEIQIDLTVAVVQYKTASGAQHYGVCSNFLDNVSVGQNVYGFIRSAPNFRMPKDRDVPIIMVGPGTGIAPFRAFWQHRSKLRLLNQAEYGKMKLFFGCRFPSMQLYKNEIEDMVRDVIITEYFVSFSRKPGQPKQYVQDNLRKASRQVYNDLVLQNGHIYVCGDVSMAEDVNKTLKFIFQENGVPDAEMMIYSLKESMRYHEDIFGITLRTAEITNRGRNDAMVKRTLSSNS